MGGSDLSSNPRLRTAVQNAKDVNMPADNIERAIKKGAGELEGVSYEEQRYEGYGPGGVAILVEALTDNKNRSSSELKMIFTKNGGNMASAGAVSWIFHKKGLVSIPKEGVSEEDLFLISTRRWR